MVEQYIFLQVIVLEFVEICIDDAKLLVNSFKCQCYAGIQFNGIYLFIDSIGLFLFTYWFYNACLELQCGSGMAHGIGYITLYYIISFKHTVNYVTVWVHCFHFVTHITNLQVVGVLTIHI